MDTIVFNKDEVPMFQRNKEKYRVYVVTEELINDYVTILNFFNSAIESIQARYSVSVDKSLPNAKLSKKQNFRFKKAVLKAKKMALDIENLKKIFIFQKVITAIPHLQKFHFPEFILPELKFSELKELKIKNKILDTLCY